MRVKYLFLILIAGTIFSIKAQNTEVTGVVVNTISNEPVMGAKIQAQGSTIFAYSDSLGKFSIVGLSPGFYSFSVNANNFESKDLPEYFVGVNKPVFLKIDLNPVTKIEKTVNIDVSSFTTRTPDNLLSSRNLSIREIERNPGGNRDISKIVQSLPGVITIPGFRNDIVIRGGAPSENKFYLDGIEIPVINHFQTQGGTGGPVGMINVNLLKEVNLYTGAFPVNLANAGSGIFDFKQIDGNPKKLKIRGTLGTTDAGITLDGPLNKNGNNFIFSARQSYLQFVFAALKLPFLPNYIDYQTKFNFKLNNKTDLTVITIGALDYFRLNQKVNEGVTDPEQLKSNNYILGYLADYKQWNYATGLVLTHYGETSKNQFFLSRDMLRNGFEKYRNNDNSVDSNKLKDYISDEASYKVRFENSRKWKNWNVLLGLGTELAKYSVKYDDVTNPNFAIHLKNKMQLFKYSMFTKWNRRIFSDRTILNLGLRVDGSNINKTMGNPLNQISGSVSVSQPVSKKIFFNVNIGRFHQIPQNTILGFADNSGNLINKPNAKYLQIHSAAAGFQYNFQKDAKISLEGFVKNYKNYPFSIAKQISLANLGADFNVVGQEAVSFNNSGQAYGSEFLIQKRTKSGVYGIASYTLAWSKFKNTLNQLVASSWDSRHTVSLTGGIKLKRNWEIGARWSFVSGRPYTPDDVQNSLLKNWWNLNGQAKPDYNKLNAYRTNNYSKLDMRIDKVWYFKHSSINLYFDIQNVLDQVQILPSTLYILKDVNGNPVTDPNNSNAYMPDYIQNTNGFRQPSVGLIVDF